MEDQLFRRHCRLVGSSIKNVEWYGQSLRRRLGNRLEAGRILQIRDWVSNRPPQFAHGVMAREL
jgi:hypothetical protein